jgi:lipid-binding SYLF domain-containing protein
MQRRTVLTAAASAAMALALLGGCANDSDPGDAPAKVQSSIDAGVRPTMDALYAKVPGSKELADKARGILVFPKVYDGAAVVGGEYGRGALIVDGRTVGYYKTTSVSLGAQLGGQSRSLVLMFMTQDALDRLSANGGWSAGTDASVALAHVGANGALDRENGAVAVNVFALNNEGLMAGVSIDGTKVAKIQW